MHTHRSSNSPPLPATSMDAVATQCHWSSARSPGNRRSLGRSPRPAGLLRQEPGAARPRSAARNAGPAVRPHRGHRLRGG